MWPLTQLGKRGKGDKKRTSVIDDKRLCELAAPDVTTSQPWHPRRVVSKESLHAEPFHDRVE